MIFSEGSGAFAFWNRPKNTEAFRGRPCIEPKVQQLTSKSHCQYNHHQNQGRGPNKKANAVDNQCHYRVAFIKLE
jgi:hypothetical protein